VQPGNSGGALVDERGNDIDIVSAKVLAHGHRVRRCWRIDSKFAVSGNNSAPCRFIVDNCI
jgi:S1-C subfamily serine protease